MSKLTWTPGTLRIASADWWSDGLRVAAKRHPCGLAVTVDPYHVAQARWCITHIKSGASISVQRWRSEAKAMQAVERVAHLDWHRSKKVLEQAYKAGEIDALLAGEGKP